MIKCNINFSEEKLTCVYTSTDCAATSFERTICGN